jgi:hypothetical protein
MVVSGRFLNFIVLGLIPTLGAPTENYPALDNRWIILSV